MLVAILSDIHANLEAFTAVITDLEIKQPDRVICLGDLIGYGPNPEEVVQLVREKGYPSVMGNHEAVLADKRLRRWFNFQARDNSLKTEELLTPENLDFCKKLPRYLHYAGASFTHGFPPGSVLGYLNRKTDNEIISLLKKAEGDLFFVGHTHKLLVVGWDGRQIMRKPFSVEAFRLQNGFRYIVNAGSVGQPRDGDNRAKYLLWDTVDQWVEAVRISYDHTITAQKIIDRGFPSDYAFRLG